MKNPHGNLLCPRHGSHFIKAQDGRKSGPWGVTCGYWRCSDNYCSLEEEELMKRHEHNTR